MIASKDMEFQLLKIRLDEIKKITDRLFEHVIAERGETSICIDKNFYWNIPFEALFDMEMSPQNLDIGSLSDDWSFLSKLVDEKKMPLARQFVELATLLRVIGEVLGDKLASVGG